jgi:hypothetical protein
MAQSAGYLDDSPRLDKTIGITSHPHGVLHTVLIHEPERSVFIVAAHHSISDGMSMTVVLRDLLRALSGEALDRYPVLPSQEELLGITGPSPAPAIGSEPAAALPVGPPLVIREGDTEPPAIEGLRLDADLTNRLVECARAEGTTVHGAISSAVLKAGRNRRQSAALGSASYVAGCKGQVAVLLAVVGYGN